MMIIIKKDDVVILRIKGPSTPSGSEGKPRDIEYDIGDIDRWEDDGGRNPGTRSGQFRWYVDVSYYFL
ncbi:hypothetical protein [Ureibacillus acetophenoni]|uniref:Uncharacterized protein n=1 Tax=Ureibacillus acetophenoni TaxID=614649 RepID=A0A285UEU0_9BACL|nr:hypothetical protein [Ureibacillus acetophenoni]SOC39898.1 hypothetical protein SAMN05877842_106176 [Ureibacillus acetophenoni]